MGYQQEKKLVRSLSKATENCNEKTIEDAIKPFVTSDFTFKGYEPYGGEKGVPLHEACANFWIPVLRAVKNIQRREDIFIAGKNQKMCQPKDAPKDDDTAEADIWVMSMGHFMGLFDEELWGMRPTGKIINLRYTEFHCVKNSKITKTGMFIDSIGVMEAAGCYPLPLSTGQYFVYPGPRTRDGIIHDDADPEEAKKTFELIKKMAEDLNDLNVSGSMTCAPEVLERTWSNNMCWFGPCGIGASYTIPRYQRQHQLPFRGSLTNKKCAPKEVFIAEGKFAGMFGWNLTHTPIGGLMGLPGGQVNCLMPSVDVYAREDDKLTENWITLDFVHWLKDQGLDVFKRTTDILNPKWT